MRLLSSGYSKLYVVSNNKSAYGLPAYKQIKYMYDNLQNLHFPDNFLKAIIMPYSLINARNLKFLNCNVIAIVTFKTKKAESEKSRLYSQISKYYKNVQVKCGQKYALIGPINILSEPKNIPQKIGILCHSEKDDGILIHSKLKKMKLKEELGSLVRLTKNVEDSSSEVVIVEYHRGLNLKEKLINYVSATVNKGSTVILENHPPIGRLLYARLLKIVGQNITITYRSAEIANRDGASKFKPLPVLSYVHIPKLEPFNDSVIRIGTFGWKKEGY